MKWKLSLTCSVFFGKSLTLFSGLLIIPDMFESVQRLGHFLWGTCQRGEDFSLGPRCPFFPLALVPVIVRLTYIHAEFLDSDLNF